MASPRTHVVTTAPLVVIEVFTQDPLIAKGLKILVILFAGVGVDLDHISRKGFKDFLSGRKLTTGNQEAAKRATAGEVLSYELFSGWVNRFHTWKGLIIFLSLSWLLGTPWIFLAFGVHIILDAGNRWNEIISSSPLPKAIYPFLRFLRLTYLSPPVWLGKSFEDWKKEYKKRSAY